MDSLQRITVVMLDGLGVGGQPDANVPAVLGQVEHGRPKIIESLSGNTQPGGPSPMVRLAGFYGKLRLLTSESWHV